MTTFPIKESFKFGWEKTKENFGTIASLFFVIFAGKLVLNFLMGNELGGMGNFSFSGNNISFGEVGSSFGNSFGTNMHPMFSHHFGPVAFLSVVVVVYAVMLTGNLLQKFIAMSEHRDTPFWDVFMIKNWNLEYVIVSILYSLLVFVGLILLIIPGLYFIVTYGFSRLLVADKHMKPLEALERSAAITKNHKWRLLGFFVLILLLNMVGGICFGVGLFVTIPVSLFAVIHVYKLLSAHAHEGAQVTA